MTNLIPRTQVLALKGFSSQASQIDILDFGKQITPNLINVKVTRDEFPQHPDYNQMAYFMYATPRQTMLAKNILSNGIDLRRAEADTLDLSRVVVVNRTELTAHLCEPLFAVWVGNLYDATVDDVRTVFTQFIVNQPVSVHVTVRNSSDGQRYAFVNYKTYEHADEALRRCSDGAIIFGPQGSNAAVAQPRGRLLFVRRLLLILQNHPDHLVSLADAEDIAKHIPVAGGSGLPDWLELLRGLPRHFSVDDAAGDIKLVPVQGLRPAGSVTRELPAAANAAAPPATAQNEAENAPAWECGLCLEAAEDAGGAAGKAALVPCGHAFCSRCCARVFGAPLLARKCPACRKRILAVQPLFGV
jgi:hypothetical protein